MRRLLCLLGIVVPAALAPVADAAFPGANGRIAYDEDFDCFGENYYIRTVNPDGTAPVTVPGQRGIYNTAPSWSPDGVRLAYSEDFAVATIKPDGTEWHDFFAQSLDQYPAWSPDGTRIVFDAEGEITIINADGTGRTGIGRFASEPAWSPGGTRIALGGVYLTDPAGATLTFVTAGNSPSWSPDGSRIAFSSTRDGNAEIYTAAVDGSNVTRLTFNSLPDHSPAWSPDGTQIAFVRDRTSSPAGGSQILRMSSTGGGETLVIGSGFTCLANPDWQPLPALGYPRPRGASPMYLSLVPAYQPCTTPNRAHGAPLAFGSCVPPATASTELTIGARSVSSVAVNAKMGNPATSADEADVRFQVEIRDVRDSADLADYTGALEARPAVRITDRDNTPHPGGPGPGTVTDQALPFPVPCTATSDETVGAICSIATTADVVVPGAVKENRRAVWELAAFEVRDAGGAVFLRQGLFVP